MPFTTATDRFMLFDHGRFVELEPRKPRQVALAGERLVYVDDQGALKVYYERGDTRRIREDGEAKLVSTGATIVFTIGQRLGMVKAGAPVMLSNEATNIGTSDSLIVFSDGGSDMLHLWWKGNVYPITALGDTVDPPEWRLGRNTFTCYAHTTGTIQAFQRGRLFELADSCDAALVACGGDAIAYWDDGPDRFMLYWHGHRKALEEFKPIDFQAGDGVLAYTDATLKFRACVDTSCTRILDHRPTTYWVHDSLVLFVDKGMLWTVEKGEAVVVENHIPEQWSVHGATLYYLNLNRELRSYRRGDRRDLSTDAAIPAFERWGDALLYRDANGITKVAWQGRVWEY